MVRRSDHPPVKGKTMTQDPRMRLSLEPPSALAVALLENSEYLVERHSIVKGIDYTHLELSAKWLTTYETISVSVTFMTNAVQYKVLSTSVKDEELQDDIDSGVGESFEEALAKVYPEHDWSCLIGEVKIRVKKK